MVQTNGTSVYRARPLWNIWEPNAVFDDRLLCIQGQNKNQDNSNINIDSLIESQIKAQQITKVPHEGQSEVNSKIVLGTNNSIKLYPNPANEFITVEYSELVDGELEITNNLGQVILQTQLGHNNTKVQVPLLNIAVGLYYYKIRFGAKELIGKLNIVQ